MEASSTINPGSKEPFVLTTPDRRPLFLIGSQSIAKDEALMRNWLHTLPVFRDRPEGDTLAAFIAFNRICEATKNPGDPELEPMKVYDHGDSMQALLLAAVELERVGARCHLTFDRTKTGHITGIQLSVEAK